MFTEVWLDNAINKIVYIPKSLVHVLKMKNEISAAKYSKKRSYSSPPPSFGGKSWMFRFQHRTKSTIRLYFLPRRRIKPDDSDEYQTPSEDGDLYKPQCYLTKCFKSSLLNNHSFFYR